MVYFLCIWYDESVQRSDHTWFVHVSCYVSLSLSLCFSLERETNVACSIEIIQQWTCSVVVSLFVLFGGSVDAYNLIQTSETVSLSSCYQYIIGFIICYCYRY